MLVRPAVAAWFLRTRLRRYGRRVLLTGLACTPRAAPRPTDAAWEDTAMLTHAVVAAALRTLALVALGGGVDLVAALLLGGRELADLRARATPVGSTSATPRRTPPVAWAAGPAIASRSGHAEEVTGLDGEAPRAGGAQPVGEDPLVAPPSAGEEDRFA
jgi:hypothetical protein